ncbi:MAG TPA: LacI family DNA-binding transcriptional regulator [Ktedonobacterales bacterium]
MAHKLTIRDIAQLAGVSTATVSRVLNNKPDVDPVTREHVMQIVREQGFVPSITASSLAGGRSPLLGVLVPSLTWPLMPQIMQSIAEVIEQTSYELVLYSISHRTDRSGLIDRILATRLIDGLLAVYPDGIASSESTEPINRESSTHLREIYEQGFPVVMLDDQSLPGPIPWVGPDNRIGAYEAVRHLVQHGHQRIAHIQGPLQYQCSHDRYAGYQQALEEAGIAIDPALVVQGDFTIASGRAAAMQLLALPDRPTAVFAANDQMAYGVLSASEAQGLRVPEDLAVIGFDDTALSAHTRPALSTVKQPFAEMGRSATEMLLALVSAPRLFGGGAYSQMARPVGSRADIASQQPMRVQWPTKLVVRESCGREHSNQAAEYQIPVDAAR